MLYTCVKEVIKTGQMTLILKYMQSGGKPGPGLPRAHKFCSWASEHGKLVVRWAVVKLAWGNVVS